ncbi:MAG TPA: DUF5302 domain-containing protein [Streptosporangiaceae bacterium]|nr:DUF5302 domain-containing protein [Gaiellales bacterium]
MAAPASRSDSSDGPEDEVKKKFREALKRKNAQADKRAEAGGKDSSKVHGTHGPVGGKRTFRRKSG